MSDIHSDELVPDALVPLRALVFSVVGYERYVVHSPQRSLYLRRRGLCMRVTNLAGRHIHR